MTLAPRFLLPLLASALLPPESGPQGVRPGDAVPVLETIALGNTDLCSLDTLRGRVVLYEFFAYWCGPCRASVPHVNGLIDEFGARGFAVVGITLEEPPKTERFVLQTGAKFAVAYVPKGKTFEEWGVTEIPAAFLANAKGKIVWAGDPMELRAKEIAKHLRGIRYAPEIPRGPASIETLLKKADLAGAYGEVKEALDGPGVDAATREGLEAILRSLEDRGACALGHAKRLEEEGDVYGALERYEETARIFAGFPVAADATAAASRIRADASLAPELEAGRRVHEGIELLAGAAYREAWRTFAEVRTAHPASAAAKRAQALQEEIKEMEMYGFDPECRRCKREGKACDDSRAEANW